MTPRAARHMGLLLLACAVVCGGGCASTSVRTNIAEDFVGPVQRLFVVARVADTWSSADTTYLTDALDEALQSCLSELKVHVISPLALDPGDIDDQVQEFGSSHVLVLEQTNERSMAGGGPFGTGSTPRGFVFNARLVDRNSERTLWRATLDSGGGAPTRIAYISSMVSKLVEAMQKDGLVRESPGP